MKCVVVDVLDKNFVLVTGPKELTRVRRRRANIRHLEPTDEKWDIEKGATDENILKAIAKAKKMERKIERVTEEKPEEEEKIEPKPEKRAKKKGRPVKKTKVAGRRRRAK